MEFGEASRNQQEKKTTIANNLTNQSVDKIIEKQKGGALQIQKKDIVKWIRVAKQINFSYMRIESKKTENCNRIPKTQKPKPSTIK